MLRYFGENGRHAGVTVFSPRMLRDAVAKASERVEGVQHVCADAWWKLGHLFRLLFRRNGTRGGVAIRMVNYNTVIIYICLSAYQGYSAADIAYRVQEAVLDITKTKALTDKKIRRVDVTICNVVGKKPEQVTIEV